MPVLGLGTWRLTGEACVETVRTALKLGYRHIDTAEHYGNHRHVAEGIYDFERSSIFLTTKLWRDYLHREQVRSECERALKELDTDYIDLYLIHWPNKEVPISETLEAMQKLRDDGMVRSIGVSNFTIKHLEEAMETGIQISANQVEFHPHLYQKELLEFCRKAGIVITAYSPLAHGGIMKDPVLREIADSLHKTPAQVSLKWLLSKGTVAIPKASSEEHLRQNMDIFGWELSAEDIAKIDSIKTNERFNNPPYSEF